MTYEELLQESLEQNLIVKEMDLPGYKGRIYKNRVAIRKNMTTAEKSCVLAEELGHDGRQYPGSDGRLQLQAGAPSPPLGLQQADRPLRDYLGLPRPLPQPLRPGRIPGSLRGLSSGGSGVLPREVWGVYGTGWVCDIL